MRNREIAERVVVMTYRPGTIRWRSAVRATPAPPISNALKRDLMKLVMEEQQRFLRAERQQL